jgi:hypothetical protein
VLIPLSSTQMASLETKQKLLLTWTDKLCRGLELRTDNQNISSRKGPVVFVLKEWDKPWKTLVVFGDLIQIGKVLTWGFWKICTPPENTGEQKLKASRVPLCMLYINTQSHKHLLPCLLTNLACCFDWHGMHSHQA